MRYEDLNHFISQNKDLFKNHKPSIQKLSGNEGRDCVISFKQGNTNVGAMQITYIGGILSISGDYGYAMFNWHNPKNHLLAFLNFKDIGYVLEKCVAGDFFVYNEDLAKAEITEYIEENFNLDCECNQTTVKELLDDLEYKDFEDECSLREWVKYNDGDLEIHENEAYHLYDAGKYVKENMFAMWYGLHEAIKQLEEEGAFV